MVQFRLSIRLRPAARKRICRLPRRTSNGVHVQPVDGVLGEPRADAPRALVSDATPDAGWTHADREWPVGARRPRFRLPRTERERRDGRRRRGLRPRRGRLAARLPVQRAGPAAAPEALLVAYRARAGCRPGTDRQLVPRSRPAVGVERAAGPLADA